MGTRMHMGIAQRWSAGPSLRILLVLVAGVLFLHVLLLLGAVSPLTVRLPTSASASPVRVRVVSPPAETPRPARPVKRPAARRVAPSPVAQATAAETESTQAEVTSARPEEVQSAAPEPTSTPAADNAPPITDAGPTPAEAVPPTLTTLPLISLGALPPSRVLSYQLTGMDKGLNYHASGELRWQHNDTAYELTLSVRAFLLGSRHWRSVGQIDATGLAPRRFSDSWRNERAAHFDREQQRIVFSSNTTPAPWQPGAQDQVSLYVQLAAAMGGEPERFVPGTRLQVQTATVRDAQPWALVLEGEDTLTLEGQALRTLKWVGQPRHQYDTRVEFWVAQQQAWLPVRIRITQVSGSYIDLVLRGSEPLPALPVAADMTTDAKGS
jgi:Protein of unknown function (DUF3108)